MELKQKKPRQSVNKAKTEENESWQIRLAKSNIEANEFQKKMTRQNHKWMIVNIIVGSILCLATVTQVLLTI